MKNNYIGLKMRTLLLALTLILAIPQFSLAQKVQNVKKVQKAFAMVYGGGDTSSARKIFKKSIKKHRDIHAAYYGLGLCAMQSDPKEAFINFKKVDGKFRNSAKDFRKYMLDNYGITQDSAKFKMDEIAAIQLRRTIMNDSTERGFAIFIRAYKGCNPKFIDRATVLKEDAAYRAARADKSLAKAKQFTADYPYSRRLNFIMEFIDSVEYFSRLENGSRATLFKYMTAYEKGRLFSLKSERIQARNSRKQEYYSQASKLYSYLFPRERLSGEFINNWRRDVYYSGHWQRLKFFYDRLPHEMVDTMKQMFYAGVYAEMNFAMQEVLSYYGRVTEEFFARRDSICDFYIRRGAPSRLALRRMQELYKDYFVQGRMDSVVAIINRYAPLFPNYDYEIEMLKRLLTENKDSCRRVRLPDIINEPSVDKPDIKYLNVKGRKIPYIDNYISYGHLRNFEAINKYPVISPDGTRLYLTHVDYKPIKLQKKMEYIHLKSGRRIVDEYETTRKVESGMGVCYSDFKNGRWQPLVRIENLFKPDSIRIDTVETKEIDPCMLRDRLMVPSRIALQFLRDKSIDAKPTDQIGIYYVGEEANSIDSASTYTSGISADNNTMYVIRPKTLQWGSPSKEANPKIYIYYRGNVISSSTNRGIDQWSQPLICGKANHYVELVPERNPHPYFGSMNAHPSADNNALFLAAGREGVPGYREEFTVQMLKNWGLSIATAESYMCPFPLGTYNPLTFDFLSHRPGVSHSTMLEENQPLFYPDIWVSVRDEDGGFGYPINLGNSINTEYAEYSPVLAADNKTLYFVSNGRSGIGGTDIYMSKRMKADSWTDWSAPINLGKYINTPYDEHDFSITADGKTAYYTSEEPLTHRQVVYKVDLPMIFRPDTIAIYKGKITNLSEEPVNAQIRVIDDFNKKTYAQYRTQPNGEFYFGLPQDRPYRFVITTKNGASATDTLGCDSQMAIVKKHDFVLPDSADVFEKHLPIPIVEDSGVDVISFLKNYDIPALEITVTAPYKTTVEDVAEDMKKRFLSIVEGKEERITTVVKTGKMKVEVRVLEDAVVY